VTFVENPTGMSAKLMGPNPDPPPPEIVVLEIPEVPEWAKAAFRARERLTVTAEAGIVTAVKVL
jgi:hypothetical protein